MFFRTEARLELVALSLVWVWLQRPSILQTRCHNMSIANSSAKWSNWLYRKMFEILEDERSLFKAAFGGSTSSFDIASMLE